MKHLMLICEGMAGEPIAELDDRTLLEAAKTPFMDLLAKKGRVGQAAFVPRALAASPEVACMSLLGYDPREFYTGIAPLEAMAIGISQNDHEVAFRCDLVTVSEESLVDTSASFISPTESQLLIKELNEKLSAPGVRFYPGSGYKNILILNDAELADALDELECRSPRSFIGQKFSKHLPKGRGAEILTGLMDKSKDILEHHEINRVRIDLKENPANMIWPWGQGKRPKMPSFKDRFGLDAAVVSETNFVHGLGKAVGAKTAKNIEEALKGKDFVFFYKGAQNEAPHENTLKSKIRLIEEFDAQCIGPAVKTLEHFSEYRLCVGTDYADSRLVPFLFEGRGVEAQGTESFSEKEALKHKVIFEEGHQLMGHFLK